MLSSTALRALCKPVHIPWPGMPLNDAADRLGRSPANLFLWVRRGRFRVKYYPARSCGPGAEPRHS